MYRLLRSSFAAPLLVVALATVSACGARTFIGDGTRGGTGGEGGATVATTTSVTGPVTTSIASTTSVTTSVTTTSVTTTSTTSTGGMTNPVISQAPGWVVESETSVAVWKNFVAVAWIAVSQSNFSGIGYAFSTDGGQTFGQVNVLKSPMGGVASDPVVAVDASGNFYVSWVGYMIQGPNPTNMHIYVAKAPSGTTTFGLPVQASDPADTASYDKPWITVTNSGTLFLTYERDAMPATYGLVAARSADGNTWTQTVFQNDPSGNTFRNLAYPCAPKDGGRIYVTYLAFGNDLEVRLSYTDDGGATWSAETTVSAPGEGVAFDDPTCASENNEVWVSYGLTQDMPDPTASNSDKSYAIRLAHSGDGGASIDTRLDAHDPMAGAFFMHPQLAREAGGALDLVYYAGQQDQDHAGTYRRSRAEAWANGFSPSVAIESPVTFLQARSDPAWLGDYTGLFLSGGELYTSYAVNTSGLSHIAFAKAMVP